MRLLLTIICLYCTGAGAAPRVVTSIPPLQEITAALMAGVAAPEVIIDRHAATHHFALKPSQLRRLQQADLVIWVGRDFESGFGRLAEILPARVQQLELLPSLGLDQGDGHFWYAPDLLRAVIAAIATALGQSDPANRPAYEANAVLLHKAIEAWRDEMRTRLEQQSLRVVTDHEFLAPFARAFAIDSIHSIHDRHDDHAGLRQLLRLERIVQQQAIACLLTQSAEISPLAAALAHKYRLRIINLEPDPIGPAPAMQARLGRLSAAVEECG